jgi:hypothetical protein
MSLLQHGGGWGVPWWAVAAPPWWARISARWAASCTPRNTVSWRELLADAVGSSDSSSTMLSLDYVPQPLQRVVPSMLSRLPAWCRRKPAFDPCAHAARLASQQWAMQQQQSPKLFSGLGPVPMIVLPPAHAPQGAGQAARRPSVSRLVHLCSSPDPPLSSHAERRKRAKMPKISKTFERFGGPSIRSSRKPVDANPAGRGPSAGDETAHIATRAVPGK